MGLQSLVLLLCAVRGAEPKNASLARARSAPLPQRLAAGRRQLSDQYAKLAASDGASYDLFGNSVAIDGDTVVVGAINDDDGGSESGAAYVFRTTDGWDTHIELKLTAADAAEDDYFGISVAIDGDTVVVWAFGAGTGGAVYVFHTSDGGATYGQVAKLTASDAAVGEFGSSVAIFGATVVVSAPWDDASHSYSGEAYVFHTTDGGATYGQVAKLKASDAAAGDEFGYSVAIDGYTIVVGASDDNDEKGSAYVFHTTDGGATYPSAFSWRSRSR